MKTFIIYFIVILISGCSPVCQITRTDGAYSVQDLVQENLSEACMLSTMDSYSVGVLGTWVGTINVKDSLEFSVNDSSLVVYFKMNQYGKYDSLYYIFGKYIEFFRLYSSEFKYSAGHKFECNCLSWRIHATLDSNTVSVLARKFKR